jgi:phosphate transport system substrate-binding protein
MKNTLAAVLTCAVFALGCKGSGDSSPTSSSSATGSAASTPTGASGGGAVTLNGAGATFPNPLYQKWISTYSAANKNVTINYQSVGSGAGVKNITDKTVDFGASDAPMSDDELKAASAPILHIATTIGAVVITYNVKDVPDKLMLSPEVLSEIFLGTIKNWNDPKIAALNPGVKFPTQAIGVAYRADGSGTTAVFTDYLSKVSADWKTKVGTGKTVTWPTGTGAKGNDGVTNQVKSTAGSLGYVELAYALQTKLPMAQLKNHAGKFVYPSVDSINAAAAGAAANLPDDLRMSITDADGDATYPIAAFTYILVYKDMQDAAKGGALANFLWWGVHDGQKLGAPLDFAALPATVVAKDEDKIKSLTAGGKPAYTAK